MVEKWGKLKQKMKRFFACGKPWHKKWWVWVVGALLTAGLITAPFIINYAYMKGLTLKEPNTAFSASDLLSLYGSILALLGTVILGVITVVQNTRSTKISQTAFDEQQRAQLPVICIGKTNQFTPGYDMSLKHWCIGEAYDSDMCFELQDGDGGFQMGYYLCTIKNISGFPILGLRATKCCIHDIGKINFLKFTPVFLNSISLADGETKEICIKLITQKTTHHGLAMDMLQIDTTFECYNPQRRRTEFITTVLIHNSRIEVLNDQIIPKYKEATTDDKI